MAYRNNNSGCVCLIALIVVAGVISGIRGCTEKMINGDLKMPKFGSSRVGGGSGSYGTSSGYNVEYKQTTLPNNNSSLRDYTHTNSQPTEYRDGKNTSPSSTNSVDNSSSHSLSVSNSSSNTSSSSTIGNNTTTINRQNPKTYYKTCALCDGTGKRNTFEWFYGDEMGMGLSCHKCGRSDKHRHDEIVVCDICSGKGRIKMEIVDSPLGEMEIRVWE